jgi:transposase InsO family protein
MGGAVKEVKRAYLQVVVDTCGSYAFGKFYTSKLPETATDILYDKVLPFYEEQKLAVKNVLTDNGRESRGTSMVYLYQIFPEVYGIDHRTTKVTTPRINGFAGRFNRTILDEFFREAFRNKLYLSLEERQADPMHV